MSSPFISQNQAPVAQAALQHIVPAIPQIDAAVDPRRGVDFVLQVFGPTTVVAIKPDEGPKGEKWLDESTKDQVSRWIEQRNQAGCNMYFHPNQPRRGLSKKAEKTDIEFIRAALADIDCYKNGITMPSGWGAITALPLEPTCTIESGGGYHPYFILREALPVTPDIVARVEALNTRIAKLTGGDAVQNCDRIMRFPHTQNYPDKKKRAVGRTVSPARVVPGAGGPRYTLEELEAALPAKVVPFRGAAQPTNTASVDDPIPGVPPAVMRKRTAMTAAQPDPRDRSRVVQRIAHTMYREGKTREQFREEIKNNSASDIVDWYKEKGSKYNDRELKRAWEKAVKEAKNNSNWFDKLKRNDKGKILPVLANAIIAFRDAPEFQGTLAYDEFRLKTVIRGPLPFSHLPGIDWTDDHDVCAAEWLQNKGIMVRPDVAGQAAEKVARERPFNPLRDYLDGLADVRNGTYNASEHAPTTMGTAIHDAMQSLRHPLVLHLGAREEAISSTLLNDRSPCSSVLTPPENLPTTAFPSQF